MSYYAPPPNTQAQQPAALSVSELNRQVKRMLEVSYSQVWVSGELSGLARPSSGHWYFSLKDERAQIRCAMFRGANQRLRFQPKEGDKVIVRGKLSLYEGRGDYQLIVDSMEPAGLGALQAAFETLKLKLAAEGLFDERNKKPIPKLPKSVCVITSRSGAVIHDIIHVSNRRFPALDIKLIPVSVQGDGAAQEIAKAIQLANTHQLADVLIVGRGGGSLEDLWAFNEELVARAIAESALPIISAVGHEVDISIADMVADLRAPTPSAAAEYITPDQFELSQKLDDQQRRLSFLLRNKLTQAKQHLSHNFKRLQHPGKLLETKAQRASALENSIKQLTHLSIQNKRATLNSLQMRLERFHPKLQIAHAQHRCTSTGERLEKAFKQKIDRDKNTLNLAANKLNLVSPLATLSRGYSVLLNEDKQAIHSCNDLEQGDLLEAKLKDGTLAVEVKSIKAKPYNETSR